MIKVERPGGPSRAAPARQAKKGGSASGAEFARMLDEATAKQAPQPVSVASPVDALLAVQEVSDSLSRRRRGRRRGEEMLAALDHIRLDILSGAIPRSRLQSLSDLVRAQRLVVDDPRLQEVLDEIELRAAVELAKWDEAE